MNTHEAVTSGYDDPQGVDFDLSAASIADEGRIIGATLAMNNFARPNFKCTPCKGVWDLGQGYRAILHGTNNSDATVMLYNGSFEPKVLRPAPCAASPQSASFIDGSPTL